MTVAVTDGADAIAANFSSLPRGVMVAGYTTGSGPVPWTAAMWATYPNAIRICQDAGATDHTADVLDVEQGAATLADCAPWARAALVSFQNAVRVGQRSPAIYCSQSNVTNVVNALIAGGVTSGIGLFVANWSNDRSVALSQLGTSGGPFPVIGVQYQDAGTYDRDLWLTSWLNNRSKKASPVIPQVPPGQWKDPESWTWATVAITGTGLDGKTYSFGFNPASGSWIKTEM